MDLTAGPTQFFWSKDRWLEFHTSLADTPVARVVLGELVCSKRLPFYQEHIAEAIETLQNAGKEVALTSLALVTLKRERKLTADLVEMGLPVEVNDLSALPHLSKGTPFWVGPLVNVYNEGTLTWLASLGATRVCLPPELPLESVEVLAKTATDLGVAVEVWGHGRLPLAISGRCYHARMHGRTKDNCQFACEDDPDGLEVKTLEGQPFMTMNGVQTLSDTHATSVYQADTLARAGVTALRLSPQSQGFPAICAAYHALLQGDTTAEMTAAELQSLTPGARFSDGFLQGACGADWSADRAVPAE
ncbi:ubiquinone anaerobic biosynthesis protein UbiV [Ruegeria arenilitoris]|uniref:ubiquinone anaerobic biosynthesis protein UbiV n=1 Tax=Ruegeria arenilitoris TaxID=1173585 RepID=UPI00147FAD10|nr:U32 family peptidase [Ruegeria arenilitoris]